MGHTEAATTSTSAEVGQHNNNDLQDLPPQQEDLLTRRLPLKKEKKGI